MLLIETAPTYSLQYVENLQNIIEMHRFNINTILWVFAIIVTVIVAVNAVNLYFSFNLMYKTKKEINNIIKKYVILIDLLDCMSENEYIAREYRYDLVMKMFDTMIDESDLFRGELFPKIPLLIVFLMNKHRDALNSKLPEDEKKLLIEKWEFINTPDVAFKIDRIRHAYNDPVIDRAFKAYINKYPTLRDIL